MRNLRFLRIFPRSLEVRFVMLLPKTCRTCPLVWRPFCSQKSKKQINAKNQDLSILFTFAKSRCLSKDVAFETVLPITCRTWDLECGLWDVQNSKKQEELFFTPILFYIKLYMVYLSCLFRRPPTNTNTNVICYPVF